MNKEIFLIVIDSLPVKRNKLIKRTNDFTLKLQHICVAFQKRNVVLNLKKKNGKKNKERY